MGQMITFKELYSNLEELKKVNLAQRRKQESTTKSGRKAQN